MTVLAPHQMFVVAALTLAALGGCGQPCEEKPERSTVTDSQDDHPIAEVDGEKLVIVTSTMTDERVTRTGLPAKGTEDVTHLLKPPIAGTEPKALDEPRDYRPDDTIEFVIDVEFDGSTVLQRSQIVKAFGDEWRKKNGRPWIYGWSPEIEHWTFFISSDAPKTFTKLAFAWPLFDPIAEEDFTVQAAQLAAYHASVTERAGQLGKAMLRQNRSPQDAELLAARLKQLDADCNSDVTVVLAAPRGKLYDGRDIWEVMLCLGLRWGDMDLFHWPNASRIGDDFFFSVWTSTPPGYFLPEPIVADRVEVRDLVFGFSIPRSAEPAAVFDSMMKAVRYAQKRLGGDIVDANGRPLDDAVVKQEIRRVVDRLKEDGFKPGRGSTLRVF